MRFQRNIMTGLLTVVPIAVTYFILAFLVRALATAGAPVVAWIAGLLKDLSPGWSETFMQPTVQYLLGIAVIIAALYILGAITNRVLGKRLLGLFDRLMSRIPLVDTIYGATRKLIDTFKQDEKSDGQRIVLIEFPTPEMKTLGLLTRVIHDADTGEKLAAVYVPTTPNPTSGYLEIVPYERLVFTDLAFDDAMTFIVSGGATAPETINYSKSADKSTVAAEENAD